MLRVLPLAGAILNDLWEFNITTKQWTWVSGSNLGKNQTGTVWQHKG